MFDKNKINAWVEEYLFYPKTFLQFLLSFSLLPFSFIYCFIVITKRIFARQKKFEIPIISIGNLTVGGSGKTPLTIELAKKYENCVIILRGYGRESKGTIVVSHNQKILCNVSKSGDEAMLYAQSLPNATVIVSEDRIKAIKQAELINCKIIFLDDGFSKSYIEKFDILIKPENEPTLPFCLPSGAYREPRYLYKKADLLIKEDEDFKRVVNVINPTKKMILVTGISKPKRLDKYLPKGIIKKIYFEDHHTYKKEELEELILKYKSTSILTTQKDAVKIENFAFKLSILELNLKVKPHIKNQINTFLANFR